MKTSEVIILGIAGIFGLSLLNKKEADSTPGGGVVVIPTGGGQAAPDLTGLFAGLLSTIKGGSTSPTIINVPQSAGSNEGIFGDILDYLKGNAPASGQGGGGLLDLSSYDDAFNDLFNRATESMGKVREDNTSFIDESKKAIDDFLKSALGEASKAGEHLPDLLPKSHADVTGKAGGWLDKAWDYLFSGKMIEVSLPGVEVNLPEVKVNTPGGQPVSQWWWGGTGEPFNVSVKEGIGQALGNVGTFLGIPSGQGKSHAEATRAADVESPKEQAIVRAAQYEY